MNDLQGHHQKQHKTMDATTDTLQQPQQGNHTKNNGKASNSITTVHLQFSIKSIKIINFAKGTPLQIV